MTTYCLCLTILKTSPTYLGILLHFLHDFFWIVNRSTTCMEADCVYRGCYVNIQEISAPLYIVIQHETFSAVRST
jgi:hypothetical protein